MRLNTRSIQRAIDAALAEGGGLVVVPAGSAHKTETLQIKSNETLEGNGRFLGTV